MGSWNTRSALGVKPTLIKRAMKRTGYRVHDGRWVIEGDTALSDSYLTYDVFREAGVWACSCVSNTEYNKTCSHMVWAMLEDRGVNVKVEGGTEAVGLPVDEQRSGGEISPGSAVATAPSPLVLSDYEPPMPDWLTELRPFQEQAVNEILDWYRRGKKVVLLDAPTGAGKSLVGELVRREFCRRAVYTATTKTLQDQILRDYPYARVVKGRSNYPTLNAPHAFPYVTAESCHKTHQGSKCDQCSDVEKCPYAVAKYQAFVADLAVLNTAYFLAEGNTEHSQFRNRGLAIIDEGDMLESELLNFAEVVVSKRALKELGIGPPARKTVVDSWVAWVELEALPAVGGLLGKMGPTRLMDARERKRQLRYERLQEKLKGLLLPPVGSDVAPLAEGWVYTDYDRGNVVFKPIRVDELAGKVLWHLADRWLLMSATIISAEQMAKDLGLDDDDWALVQVESTFDPKRRPIYVEPVASMTYKTMDTELPKMLTRISQVVDHHDSDRILIHTVSYKLANEVTRSLNFNGAGRRTFTYSKARDREQALTDFLSHPAGIMVAPSFDRGVDLHQDDCRVVIIAKVPYPALADKQINARLHSRGGQGWYAMNTVRSLVQMCGRAMRSAEDSCEIYLLDKQFMSNVWRKNRQLLPAWWQEALVMGGSEIPRTRRP